MFSNLISCFNRSRRLSGAIFIRVDDQRRGTSKDLYCSLLQCLQRSCELVLSNQK